MEGADRKEDAMGIARVSGLAVQALMGYEAVLRPRVLVGDPPKRNDDDRCPVTT